MKVKKSIFLAFYGVGVLSLVGCDTDTVTAQISVEAERLDTVQVQKGAISATVSQKTSVIQASTVALLALEKGTFNAIVYPGFTVEPGQVLGHNGEHEIVAPFAGRIKSVADSGVEVPQNYPLFELEYQGFALEIDAEKILKYAQIYEITGKFQVLDGVGPTDCFTIAAVATRTVADSPDANNSNAEQSDFEHISVNKLTVQGAAQELRPVVTPTKLACLIDKNVSVKSGQQATIVLKGVLRQNVPILPLSAVSGRDNSGKVTKVNGTETTEIAVQLGISDGGNIEILAGLSEGDEVLNRAPLLDPRKG